LTSVPVIPATHSRGFRTNAFELVVESLFRLRLPSLLWRTAPVLPSSNGRHRHYSFRVCAGSHHCIRIFYAEPADRFGAGNQIQHLDQHMPAADITWQYTGWIQPSNAHDHLCVRRMLFLSDIVVRLLADSTCIVQTIMIAICCPPVQKPNEQSGRSSSKKSLEFVKLRQRPAQGERWSHFR